MKTNSALWVIVFSLPLVGCSAAKASNGGSGSAPATDLQPSTPATSSVWTQVVNATASGGTLTKSGGTGGAADAGGVTAQQLTSGDGYFEFTAGETELFRFAGLARPHAGTNGTDIDFAFRLQAGHADLYESGVYKADNVIAAGDVLRVALTGGVVRYYKNGALIYTSPVQPSYPLAGYAALIDAQSSVAGATLTTATTSTVSGVTATAGSDGTSETVAWSSSLPGDAQVQYGASASYGSWSVYSSDGSTQHSIALTGLTAATSYHYRVRSQDTTGAAVYSADATFTTGNGTAVATNHHRFCGWLMATGYVTADQDPNYADFVAHAASFDAVHPVWYHLGSTTTIATSFGEGAAQVLAATTIGGKRTLIIPTITADDGDQPTWTSTIINSATLRAQHEAAIVSLVTGKHYDGIDLDYEHLATSDRAAFTQFATELAAKLHAQGKVLSFAVGGATTGNLGHWDYAALAAVADELHIMGYDFHYLGSHPGPVAPLGWLQQVFTYIASLSGGTLSGKFILGLPNYGLAGSDSGVTSWAGSSMDAINLAGGVYTSTTTHMSVCPLTNGLTMAAGVAPNAQTAQGHLYFDDLASMEQKVAAAQAAGLGGITYWTIGGEPDRPGTRDFFTMIRSYFPQ
jgi:chitinase